MRVAPKVGIISATANLRLDWKTTIGEWIDNALDAGATSVAVEFGERGKGSFVSVTDNGRGTTRMDAFATLGDHQPHVSTSLGRHGIGAKHGAIWAGGVDSTFHVISIHGKKKRTIDVNWYNVAKNDWETDDPRVAEALPGEVGTKLVVRPLQRIIPHGADWDRLGRELGYMYWQAIKDGAQITMRAPTKGATPRPIKGWELPRLDLDHIKATVDVAGRFATVHCGIVADGVVNDRSGLTYVHGFRVIKAATSAGCGDYNISRVCGYVVLDRSWSLTQHKDDISTHGEALYLAIEEAIRPLLERAEKAGMRLETAALAGQVSGRLNAFISSGGLAKAKRGPGERRGRKTPTCKGGKHKRSEVEQDGSAFRSRCGACQVVFENLGADAGIGEFKAPTIILNSGIPFVAEQQKSNNVAALVAIASQVVVVHECTHLDDSRQTTFRFPGIALGDMEAGERINRLSGLMLSSPVALDGRPLLEPIAAE
jgi:hypothetical protein